MSKINSLLLGGMIFLHELQKCSLIPIYDQSISGYDSFIVRDLHIEMGNK